MAPSFDFSSLLCYEEENSILSDEEVSDMTWQHQGGRSRSLIDDVDCGDLIRVLPIQSDECVLLLVKKEFEFLPKSDYMNRLRNGDFNLVSRVEAIDWISKVVGYYNFGPLCAYLAVSYLDRFLSACDISPKNRTWTMQLLAVACLSLAAKVEETWVPLLLDFQLFTDSRLFFDSKTVQRMELLVLKILKWKMQATTPFSFIDNFMYKINFEQYPPQSAITQATQLILSTIRGLEYVEFRPSEIAAAVAISVGVETQTVEVDKSMQLLTEYVGKDRVLKCLEMINGPSLSRGTNEGQNGNLTTSVPHSPIGVLDMTCLSYKSDESPVQSCANSPYTSHGAKRMKLSA